MYKKNPSTPDLHINCNLISENMPKIHPETKVLIIKRLKTRSTAEVADTFNVSQRQVQRIRKRYEETGDVFDKPRSGRPRKTTAREDRLLARNSKASPFSTAAELHETWSPEVPMSTRTVCRILSRNGLHGRIRAQKPALNKRQLKNRVAFAKAHSLPKGWTLEKCLKVDFSDESSVELHHSHRKYCRRPTGGPTSLFLAESSCLKSVPPHPKGVKAREIELYIFMDRRTDPKDQADTESSCSP